MKEEIISGNERGFARKKASQQWMLLCAVFLVLGYGVALSGCLDAVKSSISPIGEPNNAPDISGNSLVTLSPEEFYKIISSGSDANMYCDVYALRKKADPKNNGITEMDGLCSEETSASNPQNALGAAPDETGAAGGTGAAQVTYDPDGKGLNMVIDGVSLKDPKYWHTSETGGLEAIGIYVSQNDVVLAAVLRESVDLDVHPSYIVLEGYGGGKGYNASELPQIPYLAIEIRKSGPMVLKSHLTKPDVGLEGRVALVRAPGYYQALKENFDGRLVFLHLGSDNLPEPDMSKTDRRMSSAERNAFDGMFANDWISEKLGLCSGDYCKYDNGGGAANVGAERMG